MAMSETEYGRKKDMIWKFIIDENEQLNNINQIQNMEEKKTLPENV